MSRNKNLTYNGRRIIQKGIQECASKRAIGKTIGSVNIIVNEILIVHAMLHLSIQDKIKLSELAMDEAIIIHADLIKEERENIASIFSPSTSNFYIMRCFKSNLKGMTLNRFGNHANSNLLPLVIIFFTLDYQLFKP